MEIKKKVWPEDFQDLLDGKRKIEVRLADFELKEDDILVLEEYNPETKEYTGRSVKKKVTFVKKFDLLKFYNIDEIKESGLYGIGLE